MRINLISTIKFTQKLKVKKGKGIQIGEYFSTTKPNQSIQVPPPTLFSKAIHFSKCKGNQSQTLATLSPISLPITQASHQNSIHKYPSSFTNLTLLLLNKMSTKP